MLESVPLRFPAACVSAAVLALNGPRQWFPPAPGRCILLIRLPLGNAMLVAVQAPVRHRIKEPVPEWRHARRWEASPEMKPATAGAVAPISRPQAGWPRCALAFGLATRCKRGQHKFGRSSAGRYYRDAVFGFLVPPQRWR